MSLQTIQTLVQRFTDHHAVYQLYGLSDEEIKIGEGQ
jgi:hypothetical protein